MENMDKVLTESLKSRLNNMKTQQKNTSIAEVLALATMAIGKYALLSLLALWGWNTVESAFGAVQLGYWQIFSIIVGIRSISMLLIDPIFSQSNKSKN